MLSPNCTKIESEPLLRAISQLWAASSSLGVPLRCRRAIRQAAASSGGVAPQLPRDRRRCPPEPASDLLHGMAFARRSAISSRSANERYRPESGFAESPNIAGGMPGLPHVILSTSLGRPSDTWLKVACCGARPIRRGVAY